MRLVDEAAPKAHNFLMLASGRLIRAIMDAFQAIQISSSYLVWCVLRWRESSVAREHGQLTADDALTVTCDCLRSMRQAPLPLFPYTRALPWCAEHFALLVAAAATLAHPRSFSYSAPTLHTMDRSLLHGNEPQ
jgi:hypothetical protein